jgi:hypothetical protein
MSEKLHYVPAANVVHLTTLMGSDGSRKGVVYGHSN